jgi:capsular exopolysaccharide synthesis family protein
MEFRKFLSIIGRYTHIIIPMCLSAIVTAVILTYVFSEKYQSSATVLIRPEKTLDLVPKRQEILDFPVSNYISIETATKTYTEIIQSTTVAERVLKELGLDVFREEEGSGLRYYWKKTKKAVKDMIINTWILLKYGRIEEGDPYDSAVAKVRNSLSVKPTKETFLFELQSETSSPELSSAIANSATKAFVDYLKELNLLENINSKELSRDRIRNSAKRLDESRRAVVEFKEKHGIVSLGKEMELELELLSRVEKSLETTDTRISGIEAKKNEIKNQIAELGRYSKSSTKVADNPLIRELKSQLALNEIRLAGMRKRYASEHREVQALLAEIREIKEKLKTEPSTLNSEETLSVDPVYQELMSELARVETASELLRAERNKLESVIREKRSLIERMPGLEAKLAKLELDGKLNEDTHKLLSREFEEIALVTDRKSPDITVVHDAVPSLYPARPIKIYHAGFAGILSLIAGIGIALLMEHMNVTIRSIDEAEERLALPVLMTIPQLRLDSNNPLPLIGTNGKSPFEDKRVHERAYIDYPIEIRRQNDTVIGRGMASDLSLGGMSCYIRNDLNFSADEKVEISLILNENGDGNAVLDGVVLRSEDTMSGYDLSTAAIRYENVNESLSDKINQIINNTKSAISYDLPPHFEEPIRGLRSDMLMMKSQGMSTFLITSCVPQEGKSTIVTNLAMSLAEINKKVVVVDADMRRSSLHEIFGLSNDTGLSSVLFEGALPFIKKTKTGVSVLTSGPSIDDPSALLDSRRMKKLFDSLKEEFDFVLFDSPPLLAGADSAVLASMASGALVVMHAGSTTVDDFKRARQLLERFNAKILGVVINKFEEKATNSYYRS